MSTDIKPYKEISNNFVKAYNLIDDVVLKKYLNNLTEYEVLPLVNDLKGIDNIRLFKINEMVYQKNEYSTYKFATVFNSLQGLNCGVFLIIDSDGSKTDFYMGVRNLEDSRTVKSVKNTLENSLKGNFPGIKTETLLNPDAEDLIDRISSKNIVSVSCVPKNKSSELNNNKEFLQGIEKLASSMQGQRYSAVILAKSISNEELGMIRSSYEEIYTQLSPFENMNLSYGQNTSVNQSTSFSSSRSHSESFGENSSTSIGESIQKGGSKVSGVSKQNKKQTILKAGAMGLISAASFIAAPLTGSASLIAAGLVGSGMMAANSFNPDTNTESNSNNWGKSKNTNKTEGTNHNNTYTDGTTDTNTQGSSYGDSKNMQVIVKNKSVINMLEKIDLQLKRLNEGESIGMWESAAYFTSDTQETAEMVAGTYKALMNGENSGLETSAINCFKRSRQNERIYEYITNFIHPVFTLKNGINLSTGSYVSSNELGLQLGLPRKSVCGFPVINHAEFGKEVISYNDDSSSKDVSLGRIFNMGDITDTPVYLDKNSLAMHTFITGSTGSGKSNTVYKILNELKTQHKVPFLVIEPVKGDYSSVFGKLENISTYGTNPKEDKMLKINPFSFSEEIHVIEHMERLVDIFNVCWPMYAAMPALLKEAMVKIYEDIGWDLNKSENPDGNKFPNFKDLLEAIEEVIENSKYSSENKADYAGALLTRIKSLTTGLNSMIFSSDEISEEDLFEKNVIVDLSRAGSSETRSLIMGLLVMKLNEYRLASNEKNQPLKHITVLEEAHNLLKKENIETGESHLAGKSVEMLSNSIAEMRTYGEGFIIADQSPGLLDKSVIRNTNTKIILRLPDKSDRELVGYAAGLNKEQLEELTKLRRGVAAVYQNDWVEPVLVKVDRFNEKPVKRKKVFEEVEEPVKEYKDVSTQIVNFLLQGRVSEKLKFDINEIRENIDGLDISQKKKKVILKIIEDYDKYGDLDIWDDDFYDIFSKKVIILLGYRDKVEAVVCSAKDIYQLNYDLGELVKKDYPELNPNAITELKKCMMMDMYKNQEEDENMKKLYVHWCDEIVKRGLC